MGRHKTKYGTCRLCGKEGELTFEHIPPKSTFNKDGSYIQSSLEDFVKVEDPFKNQPKGKFQQGGLGNYSLCSDCNNLLGRNYVDSFRSWVLSGIEVLKSGEGNFYNFKIVGIEPLKIIKQIYSMFISFEDEDFYKNHTELCEYVRNPSSSVIPGKYQIFTYLNDTGKVRYIPPMVKGDFNTHKIVFSSEIVFPPFGYVFTINSDQKLDGLTNLRIFQDYGLDEKVDIVFEMYKLPNHLPFPLDYRTEDEINKKD